MGFFETLTKPINPGKQEFDKYDVFLAERNVKNESYKDWYNYRSAYDYYRETGIDPYDSKTKHWSSKFKHPLSPERYIKDKDNGRWQDTIGSEFVNEEKVAQQHISRLDYLKDLPLEELDEKR